MSNFQASIGPTLIAAAFYYWFIRILWGNLADTLYERQMNSCLSWFTMPGPLKRHNVWVWYQKIIAWLGLLMITLVYVLAILTIWDIPH